MKPGWKVLAGVAAAAALWFGLPALGRRIDFFRVRQVELVGARNLPATTILAAMKLGKRASVFDDVRPLERRVAAVGGVRGVRVRRRLPGSLRVEIDEAVPVAVVPRGGGVVLVDGRGRVLPFEPTLAAPDLPIAAAPDSAMAGFLAHAREADPALYAQVSAAWRVGDDVVLDVGGRRLWFRPTASAEEMHAVMAVAQDLARRGRTYAELDGRFAGQVVVRWSRG